jgi:hypothetical protein
VLLIEPVRDIQGSPSPSSSPTRGEERKEKDEILTPLDTEGEKKKKGRVSRMID